MEKNLKPYNNKLKSICSEMQFTGYAESWLEKLISIPTLSQIKGQSHILRSYLSDTIAPLLKDTGFAQIIYDNPIEGAPPFLIAKREESENLPTILIYGHGDVIRAQESSWHQGLCPFVTSKRDGVIYGRGTADNKGQHLINLLAIQAVLKLKGQLGFNVIFLLEMGEEVGSPGLATFCKIQKDNLSADVLIASDGPRLRVDTPTVFLGSRGVLNFGLEVNLRDRALHSGNWGGVVPDPAIRLSQAIASITSAQGQILIAGWRPDSLTPKIRDIIARLPPIENQLEFIDLSWGEKGLSPNERLFGWNSFSVLAMEAGAPENPINAIAGSARATCQLRYVIGTNTENIIPALEKHLYFNDFRDVNVHTSKGISHSASRQNPDNIWVKRILKSLEKRAGRSPHLLPNLAGSLPNDCFADVLGLATIWIPHSYMKCSQHAPNEHIPERLFHEAIDLMAHVFNDLEAC